MSHVISHVTNIKKKALSLSSAVFLPVFQLFLPNGQRIFGKIATIRVVIVLAEVARYTGEHMSSV